MAEIPFKFINFLNFILIILYITESFRKTVNNKLVIYIMLCIFLPQLLITFNQYLKQELYLLLSYGICLIMSLSGIIKIILIGFNKNSVLTIEEIFKQLPGHIYWKDKNGFFIGSNENNWKDFGLKSLSDYVGKTDYDIMPFEQAEKLTQADKNVINTKNLMVVEEECFTRAGISCLYLSHKVPLKNKLDEIVGILGISIDITEAKKDEIERLEMLENIIAIMPGHVYWVNRNNVYLGCNDNQARSAGLNSRREIIGRMNEDLPWNSTAKILPAALDKINEEVMTSGRTIVIEEPALLQDGSEAVFLSSKVPMRNRYNKIIGMVGISIDITAEKEAERLRLETKAAEERAETIKLFSASMAHELRTPLRAIESGAIGVSECLPRLIEAYEAAKAAKIDIPYISPVHYQSLDKVFHNLQVETEAAFSVLDMLLVKSDLSRINSTEFKTCSMQRCVEKALSRYPFRPGEADLVQLHKGDFLFYGDEILMIHIIFNLLKNALHYVKAAAKGDIQISFDQNDKFNILYFKDTGQGIAPEILPRIFERFFTRTTHGTGVGLAFCQLVMQAFGGDIRCDSVKGEYTKFTLFFHIKTN